MNESIKTAADIENDKPDKTLVRIIMNKREKIYLPEIKKITR